MRHLRAPRIPVPGCPIVVVVLLGFASVAPGATLTVRWLGPPDATPTLTPPAGPVVGHVADPAGWLTNLHEIGYYLLGHAFDPTVDAPACTEGFEVEAYHLVLVKTDAEPWTPSATMTLTDGWHRDLVPPGTICLSPPSGAYGPRYGPGWYCSASSSAQSQAPAGYYELVLAELPDCGCVSSDYTHVLDVYPLGTPEWGDRVFPAIDQAAGHCPDHAATPNLGYLWWSEVPASGSVIMWAEVTCCEPAVGTATRAWGSLKAIWR